MAFAFRLREEIESALAGRVQLRLAPRLVCAGLETGYGTLDAVLRGGLPVAGTSELVGERTSGRASVASAYVAERTREGQVCAWIDLGGELDGEACAANGGDLERLLVVRCGGAEEEERAPAGRAEGGYSVVVEGPVAPFRKDKTVGTPGVQNRMFVEPAKRVEMVDTDRMGARRGMVILERRDDARVEPDSSLHPAWAVGGPGERQPGPGLQPAPPSGQAPSSGPAAGKGWKTAKARPWSRMEQGIKAVDLLIQAGGFGTIVFDLGSVAPEYARRIPLATWFRWRQALERTRTSLVVLSQMGCAGSSAELVLRVEAELPAAGTVLRGGAYRLEVVRRRFAEQREQRRGPQSAGACAWESRAPWSA